MRLEGPVRPELLADKLRIPRLSLAILRRGRVIDLVERAAGHRVTVVSGPAGAGKTVACGSWASAAPAGRRVAWLTLDADDQDPARFWGYVQAALAGAGAIPGDAAQALRDAAAGGLPLRVAEAAQQLTEPATLVLDDVHELADGPVLAGLDLLIRHAPPTLRLILSGRCPPRLQLARLRVSGDLADVNAADLACTADEADAYFAMLGLDVDAFARDELLRRTEGWMAGLRLAAMGARSQMRENGRITDIAGDEPLVTDYLWDEVLGRQPPEIRLFMLRTSVTEQMSGDLADALTGEPGGGRTLERLSRENSFVEALGNDHAGYRYHPLLRDVLAAERAREIPHEVPILLRRAARWHAAHDQAIDALRSAAEAGDWDYAAHMLAEAGIAALVRSGAATLEQVLALFPAEQPRRRRRRGCRAGRGQAVVRRPGRRRPSPGGRAAGTRPVQPGGAPERRALAGGAAGDAGGKPVGRRSRPARAGLVHGRAGAGHRRAPSPSTGPSGCSGSRSVPRGCAAGRSSRRDTP